MVYRVEIILTIVIAIFIFVGFSIQREGKILKQRVSNLKKDVQIYDVYGVEVNLTGVTNRYRADEVKLIKGVWHLKSFWLTNRDVKSLTSDSATKDKRYIKLYRDVVLCRDDGSIYRADEVIYDTKAKRLYSNGSFEGRKNPNWVKGDNFDYYVDSRVTYAKNVYAHYIIGSLDKNRTKGK
jgi:hypothetical protein